MNSPLNLKPSGFLECPCMIFFSLELRIGTRVSCSSHFSNASLLPVSYTAGRKPGDFPLSSMMTRAFSAPAPECAPGWNLTRKPESDCPGKQARAQGLPESPPWGEGFRVFGEPVIQAPKVKKETKAEKWQPICLVVRVILIDIFFMSRVAPSSLQVFRISLPVSTPSRLSG